MASWGMAKVSFLVSEGAEQDCPRNGVVHIEVSYQAYVRSIALLRTTLM